MQIQNASTPGYGYINRLPNDITWIYPLLPGEPPSVLHREFAACVPSNVTLAETCCSAVGGSFVNSTLTNRTTVPASELQAILDAKYPGQGINTTATYSTGNLTFVQDAGEVGNIHWCAMAYNPLSSTELDTPNVINPRVNPLRGNIPESVNNWVNCFNDNVPADAINKTEAAYVCVMVDVLTGGYLEGFDVPARVGSGAERVTAPGVLTAALLLAFALLAS
ncbi:hypothetical protein IAU60_003161 [Kwoniella sp. DSM 27419]